MHNLPRIRACMVSYYFWPEYSGSAVQALNLSRHLGNRGVEPFIVTANLSGSAAHDRIDGIDVYRLPVARSARLQLPSFIASLCRFLAFHRARFDVVHAHGTLWHGIAGPMARLLGKKSLLKVAMAQSDIDFRRQGLLLGGINQALVRRFDVYIATTDAIAREFGDNGLDVNRVRLIPNGVDTETYTPASPQERVALRRQLGLPDGPLVTFVGIINQRKNIEGILRVWRSVAQRGLPGHLLLAGPRPGGEADEYFVRLRTFVAQHGLESRVTFLEARSDIPNILQASDIFFFPSLQEGMPNAVLEAMGSGLACLVSRGSGTDGVVIDGANGFSRDVQDEAGFAEVLIRLLGDSLLRASVGQAARQSVLENYSLDAVADRYLKLYRELLAS